MNLQNLSTTASDFINDAQLEALLKGGIPETEEVRAIIQKSKAKVALTVEETARLLLVRDAGLTQEIFEAARWLKREVYGNRIVLFAPLYIGNQCINDCTYCGFRVSNKDAVRRTLLADEISSQVVALEKMGHKRLILVFGEHPKYNAEFIAQSVREVYAVKSGPGEIRRVNINAAPFDVEGFKTIKAAGIGTYQVFQETYHHKIYGEVHKPSSNKGNYLWRLDSLSRAMEAGADDVGIGALFGLGDWRFEVLGLVSHARFLSEKYNCGPHTISFPRIRPASGMTLSDEHLVSDFDFKRLVAILRLAVPYTGLILTARESPALRRELLDFGVSQIDAGSRIELGGYTESGDAQVHEREQFELGDVRSLDDVMKELIELSHVPSFCTACYRKGRTGEHFMEFAIPGFIANLCTPNALTTLMEYLVDYATPETRLAGKRLIEQELVKITDPERKAEVIKRLQAIEEDHAHDLYF